MVARAQETEVPRLVLHAATRLFATRGFEGTSLQDIATEVGITKPAVLHHFRSKEELRTAVLTAIFDHWRERLPKLLIAATASEDRFDRVLGELRSFFSADPDRARLVLREILDRPDEMAKAMRTYVRPWLGAIVSYIDRGKEKGVHHGDVDAQAYTVHILTLVVSAIATERVATAALEPRADARARYDRELVRIARASLFSPPREAVARSTTQERTKPPRKRAAPR